METTTIDYLNSVDTELFYWINQHHCTVADYVLYAFTQHWMWAVMIVIFFALSLGAIVYSYYKKNSVSNPILFMLSLPLTACVLVYVFGKECC